MILCNLQAAARETEIHGVRVPLFPTSCLFADPLPPLLVNEENKEGRLEAGQTQVQILAGPPPSSVPLGRRWTLPPPQSPHLKNGGASDTYLGGQL